LPHIKVAGATATGTHGSGDCNGNLSTAVAGLELITASGDIVWFARGEAGFDGMPVGLGAFGIITRVMLDIEPTFDVRQDVFMDLPWETVLANFDTVSSAADSVSLLTKWSDPAVSRMWLQTRLREGRPLEVTAAHLGAAPAPLDNISIGLDDPSARLTPCGGVPGPWSERLIALHAIPRACRPLRPHRRIP
jgi:alditol oxidase